LWILELPITAEKILRALKEAQHKDRGDYWVKAAPIS
jgi:hypothetical protein